MVVKKSKEKIRFSEDVSSIRWLKKKERTVGNSKIIIQVNKNCSRMWTTQVIQRGTEYRKPNSANIEQIMDTLEQTLDAVSKVIYQNRIEQISVQVRPIPDHVGKHLRPYIMPVLHSCANSLMRDKKCEARILNAKLLNYTYVLVFHGFAPRVYIRHQISIASHMTIMAHTHSCYEAMKVDCLL